MVTVVRWALKVMVHMHSKDHHYIDCLAICPKPHATFLVAIVYPCVGERYIVETAHSLS